MEFMGTGMLSTLGCGCCCLAVVAVVGVAGILGMRRSRNAEGAVGGVPDAPERGSSTNARLTHMEHAPAEPAANRVVNRTLPREVVDTTRPAAPSQPGPSAAPRVISPSPTFVPPADED